MKATPLLLSLALFLSGCGEQPRWQHQLGSDRAHLAEDSRFCRLYARDIARGEADRIRIHGGAPHSGVARGFILYAVFEESFADCMRVKGWYRTDGAVRG